MRMHVSYILFAACTAAFTVATARPAVAQFTITYVDATVANTVQANSNDDGNGTAPVGFSTVAPPDPSGAGAGNDDLWWHRTGFGIVPSASGSPPPTGTIALTPSNTIFEASGNGGGENAPRLKTSVSGLAAEQYAVYVYFWDVGLAGGWTVRAGLDDSADHLPQFQGETPGVTILGNDGSNRTLYQALVGLTALNATSIDVFVDDLPVPPGGGNNDRTWYDGIGYRVYYPDGDANFDRLVDRADYDLIRANLSKTVTPGTMGDLDGNGVVTLTDFHVWKAAPPILSSIAGLETVPEPMTASLALAAGLFVAGRRRRNAARLPSATQPVRMASKPSVICLVACTLLASSLPLVAQAQIAYVDATPSNTLQAALSSGPVGAGIAWAGTTDGGAADDQWWYRAAQGLSEATTVVPSGTIAFDANSTVMEASGVPGQEDAPRLATTVTGLTADTYDVYAYFWVAGGLWNLRAGLEDSAAPLPVYGSTDGVQVAATDSLQLRQVFLGQVTGTSITVYAEDRPATGANTDRTWYDGFGYVPGLLPGDVNGDDLVDLADYALIKDNFFLNGATRGQGDLTGDGRINLDDYALWRSEAPQALVASLGVPEPGAALLACCGAALGSLTRRRR
ncbi:MAG: hypothetical protein KDA61_02965 [Planctomycetales bacterium]|nr:hypothetical protein [Planctomycetales bacterium]